jgi:hypothetical protein
MTRRTRLAVPLLLAVLATAATSTAEASAASASSAVAARPATTAGVVHPFTWVDTQAYFGDEATCNDWGAKMLASYPNSYDDWACVQNNNGTWELWLDYYG